MSADPAAQRLATAWKTFDPAVAFQRVPGDPMPGPMGQDAKGFTIWARTPKDATELQAKIDREIARNGLSYDRPRETGNVDFIEGQSNRVGTVRDKFTATATADGRDGALLDTELAKRIEDRYGARMSENALRDVESQSGIRPGLLQYDRNGKLMMLLSEKPEMETASTPMRSQRTKNSARWTADRHCMRALAYSIGIRRTGLREVPASPILQASEIPFLNCRQKKHWVCCCLCISSTK